MIKSRLHPGDDERVPNLGGAAERPVPVRADGGFSLVEVVVASTVLGVLAGTLGMFFLSGIRTTAELLHRQQAASLATQAMELITAVSVQADGIGCVPLLNGRTQSTVTTQWAAAPAGVDLSTSDATWNGAACPATVSVPLAGLTTSVADDGTTPAVTRDGVGYTVRTYIGSCRQPPAGGTCTKSTPGTASYRTMYRIVVAVGWRGSACPSSSCLYTVSTLRDPSPDPLFNLRSSAVPTAVADTVCTGAGTAALVSLLSNDSGLLGGSPVTVVSAPGHGSLSAGITTGTGIFTPAVGYVGLDSFTYRLTSSSGVQSASATVTVKIGIAC